MPADRPTQPTDSLRPIAISVFLPTFVYQIGQGAVAPIVALSALDVGASVSVAGLMMALLGIGQLLGDLPASALADRFGDRTAMITASGLSVGALTGCLAAPNVITLGLCLCVAGMSNATYFLARQSYLTNVVPVYLRARAMSSLGGSHRIGLFIGPFVGAAAIGLTGLRAAYVVGMLASLASALILVAVRDVEQPAGTIPPTRQGITLIDVMRTNARLFLTLGIAIVVVGAVRAARQTVLPLWAEHLGTSAAVTSLVFGIGNATDMALFYPAGKVMDQIGRLWVAVPSMLILAAAMMTLPLAHSLAPLILVALALGVGNGISSGVISTIGADVAPLLGRAKFFGVWRLLTDTGNAAGPAMVSGIASVWTLAAGIAMTGSLGILAALALATWLPRFSSFARRRDMKMINFPAP